jgi:hypothetical protein
MISVKIADKARVFAPLPCQYSQKLLFHTRHPQKKIRGLQDTHNAR